MHYRVRLLTCLVCCLTGMHTSALRAQPTPSAQPALRITSVSLAWPRIDIGMKAWCGGIPVSGIDKFALQLKENGQTIDNFTVACSRDSTDTCAVVLVIDHSGSMSAWNRLDSVKQACHAFIRALDGTGVPVAIVIFDNSVLLLQSFTRDQSTLHAAVNSIGVGARLRYMMP